MSIQRIRSKNVWNRAKSRFELGLLEIRGSKIDRLGFGKEARTHSRTIDFDELHIGPSAIDLHVHSRDFQESHKETFETLEAGAFAGGVSTVVCMANTRPRLDSEKQVRDFLKKASRHQLDIRCFAAVTENLEGTKATDWDRLLRLPIAGLSDDGKPILDEKMMEACLRRIKKSGKLLSLHEEDTGESCGSVLHRAEPSMRMGIEGSPSSAESRMVERDLRLAEKLKAHLHFGHISAKESVLLFKKFKKRVSFSAELTPHHALLVAEDLESLEEKSRALFKVCPVIRTPEDRKALLDAARTGYLDCFASDHAPHSFLEKELPLSLAAHGIISMEYHYPLYLELRRRAGMSWARFFRALSERPAELLGLSKQKSRLERAFEASFVVFDPNAVQTIDFKRSKSRNSPLQGQPIHGRVEGHWVKGKRVYAEKSE